MSNGTLNIEQQIMGRWFSLYLDIVRLMAATFVVYAHSNVRFLYPEKLPLAEYAHSAVTVFFVLSGYVVAFVVDRKENTPIYYTASRASRILSLSVLAVLLTPVIDAVGRGFSPELYGNLIPSDYILLRIAASFVFLAEVWFISITTFSNVPYWSLNYEVWYYVLFGIYCFAKPPHRWLLICLICLLLGPKIVLMAPCWLAGVFAYRWKLPQKALGIWGATALWIGSALSFWVYHYLDLMRGFSEGVVLPYLGEWLHTQLHFSRYFAADWLLSSIIVLNFIATRRLASILPEIKSSAFGWVNFVGGLTYALYITHFPFLYMWGAFFQTKVANSQKYALVLALVVLSVGMVALLGEWLRPRMRRWIESMLIALDKLILQKTQEINRA
jgi:peptidoglycan/LPS O-acetylase OafA/YrhL